MGHLTFDLKPDDQGWWLTVWVNAAEIEGKQILANFMLTDEERQSLHEELGHYCSVLSVCTASHGGEPDIPLPLGLLHPCEMCGMDEVKYRRPINWAGVIEYWCEKCAKETLTRLQVEHPTYTLKILGFREMNVKGGL